MGYLGVLFACFDLETCYLHRNGVSAGLMITPECIIHNTNFQLRYAQKDDMHQVHCQVQWKNTMLAPFLWSSSGCLV